MSTLELVFIPTPAVGHLVSTMEFARCLLDQDDRFSITVLIIKSAFEHILDAYIQSIAASHPHINFIHLPRADPPPEELLLQSAEKYLTDYIERHISHIKEAIVNRLLSKSIPIAGLVVDMFCTAMIDVAHDLGVPSYVFFTSSAALLGFLLCLPARHAQVGIEFNQSDRESAISSYVNLVPPSALPSFAFNKEGGYISMLSHGRRLKEAQGIVVNTFYELESHAFDSLLDDGIPPVYGVGPLIHFTSKTFSDEADAERDKICKWLDDQPPSSVVFLCFGSWGSFSPPQLKEIAIGLERSGHRFLWSMRLASTHKHASLDPRNLEEVLPPEFLERTRRIGMLCGWAPQVEVLAHKAVGGFVSHCGWNSILESFWHGVPIAAWPIYAEQQINAFQMVQDLGLAVELKSDYRPGGELVKAKEIEKAVKSVMDCDSEIRRRMKDMSGKSRKAVMDGGSSFASIGGLIEAMSKNSVVPTVN